MTTGLLKEERQNQILQYVLQHSQATVVELSDRFRVSEATVRRDLEELAESGTLRRTHGGALREVPATPEAPVHLRALECADEKRRIGEKAAALILDGDTVFIGSGTTTQEVARAIKGKRHITVITNALNVANQLAADPEITLILLGGLVRSSELSMVGHLTEQALREVRADKVIIGIHAIHPQHGLTNEYLQETLTDRAIIDAGEKLILVVDHTKFGKISAAFVAGLEAIHILITDAGAPESILEIMRQAGTEIILA